MGFTISNYSLFGLQPQSFYVSIHGAYHIRKLPEDIGPYLVVFTIYYHGSKGYPAITQKEHSFNIQELPEPADVYVLIYNEIKKNINPDDIHTITDD